MTHWMAQLRLLILGCFLHRVKGQVQDVHVIDASPFTGAIYTSSEDSQESPDDAMAAMRDVTSLSSFLHLLRRDGRNVSMSDIISNITDSSGAMHINSGGRFAQPDDCSPRDTTIRLTFDNSNPNQVYFPRCTKIERCGGCCASPNLECVPSYTERVSYKVIKAEISHPGSQTLDWKGDFATVILDRHVNCRVQCTLTPSKCGPKKDYNERSCECRCRSYQRCQPPRVWDPEECECKCAETLTCCKNGERCGLTFSRETCECGIDTDHLHISSNITQEQIDAYHASLDRTSNSTQLQQEPLPEDGGRPLTSSSGSPAIPTDASTTTTLIPDATTAEPDPCAAINCPIGFTRQRQPGPEGGCSCRRNTRGGRNGGAGRK